MLYFHTVNLLYTYMYTTTYHHHVYICIYTTNLYMISYAYICINGRLCVKVRMA